MDKFNEYDVSSLSLQEMRDINGGGLILDMVKSITMNVINTISWFRRKIVKRIF